MTRQQVDDYHFKSLMVMLKLNLCPKMGTFMANPFNMECMKKRTTDKDYGTCKSLLTGLFGCDTSIQAKQGTGIVKKYFSGVAPSQQQWHMHVHRDPLLKI